MPQIARPSKRMRQLSYAVLLVGLCALLGLSTPSDLLPEASAEGAGSTPRQPGRPAGKDPTLVWGANMFDQAIRWVNDGKPGVNNVTSFFAHLDDVQLDVEDTHQEGFLRLWFKSPDKFRQEWRATRQLAKNTPITTKILRGKHMWVIPANGVARRIHTTPEGAKAVRQLQQDRDRLADIAKFLTLQGLKGPGVSFKYLGPTSGTGTFAGNWVKIRRTFPDGATMEFFFAYKVNAQRRVEKVTYPGVVVVQGDVQKREPTEAYVLSNWKAGPQFRYPGKIEAYSRREWVKGEEYKRVLLAFPSDIRINPKLLPDTFGDPMKRR